MTSSVLGSFRRAREWAYPQLTSSAFLEKGVLTPEEFVKAGDELVFRCPTWEWSSSGSSSKQKSYLPPDKQYLITRNVPCRNRVSSLETNLRMEVEVVDGDGNGNGGGGYGVGEDWMISSILADGEEEEEEDDHEDDINNNNNIEDDFDILDEDGELVEKTTTTTGVEDEKPHADAAAGEKVEKDGDDDDDNDDEYADMDDYEDDDILVDDDAAAMPSTTTATAADADADADADAASNNNNKNNNNNQMLVKTRTYDLSITYDKYYQVPRVWIVGRDEQDQPLTSTQMMEDVISDYANKTVTMETHPHVSSSCPHASIHPCQHAKVMKAIVRNLIKGSNNSSSGSNSSGDNKQLDGDEQQQPTGPSVETYLFIFLKFVSSMIPTINYDFTMEVTADTS